jgi:hypothetical protein
MEEYISKSIELYFQHMTWNNRGNINVLSSRTKKFTSTPQSINALIIGVY